MSHWTDFLQGASPPDHAVQVYRDVDELAGSVSAYLASGFEAGEAVLVVASPQHWQSFAGRLVERGWDADGIERRGQLRLADSDETLAAVTVGGRLSRDRFEAVVGALIDRLADGSPGRPVRAFGDMVDLLCERGDTDGAAALEELWNGLARRRGFSLLCGYRIDLFDRAAQVSVLPEVCRAHSLVLPAADPERLQRAVESALDEELGPDAGKIYALSADHAHAARVSTAQLALMWVSANMPAHAERVLASARERYLDGAEPAAASG